MIYFYDTTIILDGHEIDVAVEYRADKPYAQTREEPGYDGDVSPVSMTIAKVPVTGPLLHVLFDQLDHGEMLYHAFGEI